MTSNLFTLIEVARMPIQLSARQFNKSNLKSDHEGAGRQYALSALLSLGGAEKSVKLLCEGVVRAGVEVVVVSLHPGEGTIVETLNGVKVYRLPIDNVYWPFDPKRRSPLAKMQWHLRDVWNHAARLRFSRSQGRKADVVHTNNLTGFSVSLWSELRAQSLPIVHTLRDYSLFVPACDFVSAWANM